MNPKQTAPLLVTLAPAIAAAPPLLIGGAIGLGIVWLIKELLDRDGDKQPETIPANPDAETSRKSAEIPVFRETPAIPSASTHAPSAPRVASRPSSVRPASAAPVTAQAVAPVVQATLATMPRPVAKKTITRADMAMIFDAGKRSLSRLDAVAALKRLGFGKTAAYSATSPDGRFSAWLIFASDGIIYWADGQTDK